MALSLSMAALLFFTFTLPLLSLGIIGTSSLELVLLVPLEVTLDMHLAVSTAVLASSCLACFYLVFTSLFLGYVYFFTSSFFTYVFLIFLLI